ncbi:MAG TPA: NAD-dependent epimerase/dehydratase family protein [Mycobacterium sp.]|nr:NAD-dependent epimerase/dehydratase family protein [Mycobacterium sp.]
MLAFVTGGTGLVGSNLVAGLLGQGVDVRVLSQPGVSTSALDGLEYQTHIGDILDDVDALAAAMTGCAWVFHVAAISDYWRYRGQQQLYRTNVEGTRNMLAAALRAGVQRFVLTSSIGALGVPAPGHHLTEADEFNLRPRRFPYGYSKYLAEGELRRAVAAGLPAVAVNPSVVIGPRDVNQINSAMFIEAERGRLRIAPPGGTNFVAVADVVAGHIAAAQGGRIGERYILAGENLSFRDAFGAVCAMVGRPPPKVMLPRWVIPVASGAVAAVAAVVGPRLPIDAKQMRLSSLGIYADGGKARRELGVPLTPFRTAIGDAYAWYREHGYLSGHLPDSGLRR